jgi:hypothetical protein
VLAIDHVIVVVHDLDAAARRFEEQHCRPAQHVMCHSSAVPLLETSSVHGWSEWGQPSVR